MEIHYLLLPKLDQPSSWYFSGIVIPSVGIFAAIASRNQVWREGDKELSTKHLLSLG